VSDIEDALRAAAAKVDRTLDELLPKPSGIEGRVAEAMRYATLSGGKRFRPFLVLCASSLFRTNESGALRVAAAIEMVHSYSLVHDDLPAMDDDDMRRGQASCHVKFDEATAILAGDALLTLAFEVISAPATHENPDVRCRLVQALATAAGGQGMVGGQMLDLRAADEDLTIAGVSRLQRLKTGALIAFACESGAILGRASREARQALRGYAHDLGLAFQIADDLLDADGDAEEAGKAVGKDAAAGKATFVSILGLDRARTQAVMLAEQATDHLDLFDKKAEPLRKIVQFVVDRRH
jgi:farnesyl diphosphate synthase